MHYELLFEAFKQQTVQFICIELFNLNFKTDKKVELK